MESGKEISEKSLENFGKVTLKSSVIEFAINVVLPNTDRNWSGLLHQVVFGDPIQPGKYYALYGSPLWKGGRKLSDFRKSSDSYHVWADYTQKLQ